MRINNNIPAMAALNALTRNDAANQKSSLHLSSGYKINSAAEDAAGFAISNKLSNQLNGVDRASVNSSNGISIAQTAEGALDQIQAAIQRVRELAVQASNDTNTTEDREKMQAEIDQLVQEVDSMAEKCEYNKMKLLRGGDTTLIDPTQPAADGNYAKIAQGADNANDLILQIQVGANKDTNMDMILPRVDTATMGKTPAGNDASGATIKDSSGNDAYFTLSNIDVRYPYPFNESAADTAEADISGAAATDPQTVTPLDKSGSYKAIQIADQALEDVSKIRARIGAYQNRMEYTVNNLNIASDNTSQALSRVIDTDMAAETTEYAKTNVMMQAGISVLAQANQRPQMVLQLIK